MGLKGNAMNGKIVNPEQPLRSTLERLIAEAKADISKSGFGGTSNEMADSASLRVIARVGLRLIKEQQDRNKLLERIAVAVEKGFWS